MSSNENYVANYSVFPFNQKLHSSMRGRNFDIKGDIQNSIPSCEFFSKAINFKVDSPLELSIIKEKEDPVQTPEKDLEKEAKFTLKRDICSFHPFSIEAQMPLENYIIARQEPLLQKLNEKSNSNRFDLIYLYNRKKGDNIELKHPLENQNFNSNENQQVEFSQKIDFQENKQDKLDEITNPLDQHDTIITNQLHLSKEGIEKIKTISSIAPNKIDEPFVVMSVPSQLSHNVDHITDFIHEEYKMQNELLNSINYTNIKINEVIRNINKIERTIKEQEKIHNHNAKKMGLTFKETNDMKSGLKIQKSILGKQRMHILQLEKINNVIIKESENDSNLLATCQQNKEFSEYTKSLGLDQIDKKNKN